MNTFRLIVCGSRSWTHAPTIHAKLNQLLIKGRKITLVHGDAQGADKIAKQWGENVGGRYVTVEPHPPNYLFGEKAQAPLVRNEEMAKAGADLCLAFWDGQSRGTAHMIAQAVRHRIPVEIVAEPALTAQRAPSAEGGS